MTLDDWVAQLDRERPISLLSDDVVKTQALAAVSKALAETTVPVGKEATKAKQALI